MNGRLARGIRLLDYLPSSLTLSQIYVQLDQSSGHHQNPVPLTTITFDPDEELIWTGSEKVIIDIRKLRMTAATKVTRVGSVLTMVFTFRNTAVLELIKTLYDRYCSPSHWSCP